MAELNPPFVIDGTTVAGEEIRRTLKAQFDTAGVLTTAGLAITANGTPNMSVNVAAGEGIIFGTEQAEQGAYHVYNDATVNKTIAASDPTNPRLDIVVAKVQDAEYSGATRAWSLAVVTGTPAASPADPSVPANSISLARVAVGAGVTTITSGNITDLRSRASYKPWNLPWGVVFKAAATTGQGSITSLTDLTGLTTGSITPVANRVYKVTVDGVVQSTIDNDIYSFIINNGAAIKNTSTRLHGSGAGLSACLIGYFVTSGSAVTIKAQLNRALGSGTLSTAASATNPLLFLVEDIGPATAV